MRGRGVIIEERRRPLLRVRLQQTTAGLAIAFVLASALFAACGGSDNGADSPTASVSPSPSPAPRDPEEAEAALHQFVSTVQAGELEAAWSLYAASVPGDTSRHRSDRGCEFGVFTFEFPAIKHLFERTAPFEVIQWYGSALGGDFVELSVRSADGASYLATLARSEAYGPYQLMFLNNGRPAIVPGAPDPLPSPEDPKGFCGIWTGSR
jgi:hypothetical protein